MMSFWTDGRQALRRSGRSPLFSAAIVLTMGAGLGVSATANSLLYAVVLRPISAPSPEQLVAIRRVNDRGQPRSTRVELLDALGSDRRLFAQASPYAGPPIVTVEWNERTMPQTVEFVAGDYFEMLGTRAAAGRLLGPDDIGPGGTPDLVVVLSHRVWKRSFGGDAAVIGQELDIEGMPVTVIGVTDARFTGLQVDVAADLLMPLALMSRIFRQPLRPAQAGWLIARLQRGVSMDQASERVARAWSQLLSSPSVQMSPQERRDLASSSLITEPIGHGFSPLRRRYAAALYLLSALGLGLLALTSVNVAALVLGRASARADEFFIRSSLGATRRRLVRQLLAETTLIALAATAVGIPLAWWATQAIAAASWTGLLPMTLGVTPDGPVLAMTVLLGAVAGAAVGTLPGLYLAARATIASRFDRRFSRSSRAGRYLLGCQVALSVPVVFAAGLLVRTLDNLQAADTGVDGRRVLLLKLVPRPGGYERLDTSTYYPALADSLSALPGVAQVSFSHLFPAVANEAALSKVVRSVEGRANPTQTVIDVVSPRFFEVTGIPRLSGRDLSWRDDGRAPRVALLNSVLARLLFGSADATGRRVAMEPGGPDDTVEVVGVVAAATMGNVRSREVPVLYRPMLQAGTAAQSPFVQIRTHGDPRALGGAARLTVERLGREYPLATDTLDGYLRRSLARERTTARVAALFGGFALVLACVGVYAHLAHSVSRRTREIGVRMAIGATRSSVGWRVARGGILTATGGLALGFPAAIAIARLWSSTLFEVAAFDTVTIAAVAGAFLLAAAGAAWIPARLASRIEPMVALRAE